MTGQNLTWDEWYEIAKEYYKNHGNWLIAENYRTKEGYRLGFWVVNQRNDYRHDKLTKQQIVKLQKINFDFKTNIVKNQKKHAMNNTESINQKWLEIYNLIKKYYEHYGHLDMPINFKTKDGINYDEDGVNTYYWLANQRRKIKEKSLNNEKIILLLKLKMLIEIQKNKNYSNKIQLLAKNNIDYEKLDLNVKKQSYQELNAKINYLKHNKLPLIENNQLHKIFYMSNEQLLAEYKISLEEMICYYYEFAKNSKTKSLNKKM